MSEKIKVSFPEGFETVQPFEMDLDTTTVPEYMPSPVEEPLDPVLARGERGALNVGEIVDSTKLTWHGLRTAVSEKRKGWAENRQEKMDHKDAFYADTGAVALHGATVESPARARRASESFRSRKIDKKFQKKMQRDIYQYRAEKIYGKESDGVGYTKNERVVEKIKATATGTLKGETASERRRARDSIAAEPVRYGAVEHKRSRKKKKRADKKFDRAVEHPVLSKWRDWRRNEAIKDIQRHHENAEKHRQKREEIERG